MFLLAYGSRVDFHAKCVRFRAPNGAALSIQVRRLPCTLHRSRFTRKYIHTYTYTLPYIYILAYGNRDVFTAKCVRFRAQDGAALSIQASK